MKVFEDRIDAGKKLAEKLKKFRDDKPIVLAIPRGGVVVAAEVSKILKTTLDLIIPRKIGSPGDPEFAIGAVAEDGSLVLNEKVIRELLIDKNYIRATAESEIKEIKRRMKRYRGNIPYPELKNKIIIVVDDGIATGHTIEAAILSIKNQKPKSIVIAVPVAPIDAIEKLKKKVDEMIVLYSPEEFFALSMFYKEFGQTTDEEVVKLLKK